MRIEPREPLGPVVHGLALKYPLTLMALIPLPPLIRLLRIPPTPGLNHERVKAASSSGVLQSDAAGASHLYYKLFPKQSVAAEGFLLVL